MTNHNTETLILAGGCFWCTEAVFQMIRGITGIRSGYTGGTTEHPSYEEVCTGETGHAEAIEVTFDPSVIRLQDILAVFFSTHDPTTRNRQGHDIGTQYRSAIFYTTQEQKTAALAFIQKLTDDQVFANPIVTDVQPAQTFYPAEEYHQNYYRTNTDQPYCQAVINPKLQKLRASYQHLLTV